MLCVNSDLLIYGPYQKNTIGLISGSWMSLLPERQILKWFFSGDATSEPAHNQTEDSRMILFERECAFSVVITISINVFPSQFNQINLNVNTGNPLPLQKYIYFRILGRIKWYIHAKLRVAHHCFIAKRLVKCSSVQLKKVRAKSRQCPEKCHLTYSRIHE